MTVKRDEEARVSSAEPRVEILVPQPEGKLPTVRQVPAPLKKRADGRHWLRRGLLLLALVSAATAVTYWWLHRPPPLPPGFASGNGRLEADEIDIDTKFAGRISKLLVDEGDLVQTGQTLAVMDTRDLQASLDKATAVVSQTQRALDEAKASAAQQQSEVKRAEAVKNQVQRALDEAKSNLEVQQTLTKLAKQELDRTAALAPRGYATVELLDQRRQQMNAAIGAENAATARVGQAGHQLQAADHQLRSAIAASDAAAAKVGAAEHGIDAASRDVQLYEVNIADNTLVAPREGRIQYRVANAGEVLPSGGKVFTMLDTSYVYMDVYLVTSQAGRIRIGSDARIVLDAYPTHIIPAKVVFVASQAQFTPKTVETKDEREKLTFRIRVRIDPDRLQGRAEIVRSGLPGVAYVRYDPTATWPEQLKVSPAMTGEMTIGRSIVARLEGVSQVYRRVAALDDVTVDIPSSRLVGLVGPDGVGKSTLLSLVAGARQIQSGWVAVLGGDMSDAGHRAAVCPRIAYMPQGLGKNLYPDLSVWENIEFFGRVFGQSRRERQARIRELLNSTGLAPFAGRAAKKLSGGMRQKLGLCCALIHDPDLLILDEPTTGVDPLSRRQFWELIDRLRARPQEMSVLVATAYMEEAERFDWLIAMDAGKVVAAGSPTDLKKATGARSIEEAFISLMPGELGATHRQLQIPPRRGSVPEPVIVARSLTRRFGDFTAVDRVSFSIERGEIFGFVGSNGCGKTTTMKMLTGLLPPSEGEALLFGRPVDTGDLASRARVGYMSQSFSLYAELTVAQNLDLHARLFHLPHDEIGPRIEELVGRFGLGNYLDQRALGLPLGIRQRLSLAVAVVHRPEMLILDEPTSGVDPLARDRFWELLVDLSRNEDVTIFVSTHFMNEAARCDRLSLMHSGRVLATDTPAGLVAARKATSLEDAFIGFLEEAEEERRVKTPPGVEAAQRLPVVHPTAAPAPSSAFSPQRLYGTAIREALELLRDPIRLAFALFGTCFLMLVFGFGISTDVNNLTFAVLDRDQSHASRAYLEEMRGSPYFAEMAPLETYGEMQSRIESGEISAGIEIPPGFGRDIARGRPAWVAAWLDGTHPFIAQTVRGYLQGMHQIFLSDPIVKETGTPQTPPASIEVRFKYNQTFDSIYAMVPSIISLLLALFPAILMALAIVREKELGSITNLYVTPVTRLEFLLGKQLPYIAFAVVNFAVMLLMALFVFNVPLKGSFWALLLGVLIYVTATTGYGMLISAFTRTQIAALFGTAILTVVPATEFSGMLTPVSALSGIAQFMGRAFPMTYFLPVCVGTFTKGLGFSDLASNLVWLAAFVPVLTIFSLLLLRKQEG